jgi:hypothetical protein
MVFTYYVKANFVTTLGFSCCWSKPNHYIFLEPIIMQLRTLEKGIEMSIFNNTITAKFFVIFGVFDKPARRDVLNIIGSTGFFGCLKCLQPGETYKTDRGN